MTIDEQDIDEYKSGNSLYSSAIQMAHAAVWDLEGPTIPTIDAAITTMLRRGDGIPNKHFGFKLPTEGIFSSIMMLPPNARGPISNHLDQKLSFDRQNLIAMGIAQDRGYSIYIETANPTYRDEAGRCVDMEARLEREHIRATVRWERVFGKARKIDGEPPSFIVEDYSPAAIYFAGIKRVPTILVIEGYQFIEDSVLKSMRSGRLIVTTHEDLPKAVTYIIDRLEGKDTELTKGFDGMLPVKLRGVKAPSRNAT